MSKLDKIPTSDTTPPPSPPKDRVFKEPSWLETLTFGLYKTKSYHKKHE